MPSCDGVCYILMLVCLQNFSESDYFAASSKTSLWLFCLLGCDTVVRCVFPHILKDQNTFIFRVKQGKQSHFFSHCLILKMKVLWSFKTSGATRQTTRCHILEEPNVSQFFCENMKSHFMKVLLYFYRYFMFKLFIKRFGDNVYSLLRRINLNLRR